MEKNIMVLFLENNMNNERELHRIRKDDSLQLCLGHSLQGKHIRLFTNFPMKSNIFIRDSYQELEIINPTLSKNKHDSFDNYGLLTATLSGAFQFFFTEDGNSDISNKIGEGYFIVDPRFTFESTAKDKSLHWELDGLVLQTYLSKNLGPFPEWEQRVAAAINGNYNMVHFTPLQELGYSRSAYSLRDQLNVNPWFSTKEVSVTWDVIEEFIQKLSNEYHCLSMTDLVYNHTSNDSPWIHKHPECGYNVVNSPHLRPAYLLDRVVWSLTIDMEKKEYVHRGLSNVVNKPEHLEIIRNILRESINDVKLHEFYLVHIDHSVEMFKEFLYVLEKSNNEETFYKDGELVLDHGTYRRYQSQIDFGVAANHFYKPLKDINGASNNFRKFLEDLNQKTTNVINSHLEAAIINVIANISYRFIEEHGLKLPKVTVLTPLMWNYFYHPHPAIVLLKECEENMDTEPRIMAFNGWVMNHDPLSNFAEETSNVYLRRELIVWGDSVKLRYGNNHKDCPYLWDHMFKYTELTAKIFHAVRLDNCHSTPIHVAQAMLDRARAVRPDLYIVAELFTGSEGVDNLFVNKLGINSLIREALSAWDSHELGRLVYKYGGLPVGSFVQQSPQLIQPSTAHALLYDMTHDNESPVCKRSPFDLLPSAATIGMACCAIGSTRGYDEMVPHYIDVVNEERYYTKWNEGINFETSIVYAKSVINKLHHRLAAQHYNEVFVDQLDCDVVGITRLSPSMYKSVLMVSHTAFNYPGHNPEHRHVKEIHVSGKVTKILIECRTIRDKSLIHTFQKQKSFINGLPGIIANVSENLNPNQSSMVSIVSNKKTNYDTIYFKDFPAGSIIAIEVELTREHIKNIEKLKHDLDRYFSAKLRSGSKGQCLINELNTEQLLKNVPEKVNNNNTISLSLKELLAELSINELNRLLFRCHEEEMAEFNCGTYEFENYGKLVFCGLQGIISEMNIIRCRNDLGHVICDNLRQGNWLMDYISNRLLKLDGFLEKVGEWFKMMFDPVKMLPRYMVPTYFDMVVSSAYKLAVEECYYKLGNNVLFGSSFVKSLAMGSVMLCSEIRNCKLPPLTVKLEKERSTLSAGFPHFAEGIWRNWGRDTFVALRGLTILTSRYEEARSIILTYASTIRHGLVPNLLGDGFISRFNARDATWFWLNSIKQYELSQKELGDDGVSVLMIPVTRMYPSDDDDGHHAVEQPLCDIIQEVLQRHGDGIHFHERNAGHQIDNHMQENGFYVDAGINDSTKFPFGGNEFNCGTWMDKMGSCSHAGNKGRPATPRDGSAVELVGLCASVLEWLNEATKDGKYQFPGIKFNGELLTWNDWFISIKGLFEDLFFIPLNVTDPSLVSNRGIYRDSINSSLGYTDCQFRPNFLITMTVAPSLFNVEHAWHALEFVEKELLGPLGLKTLSPRDWAYRGYYDNSNNSGDPYVAHGFNYHQGPEWLWLTGYYIRSKLIFSQKMFAFDSCKYGSVVDDTIKHVTQILGRLHNHINNSKWRSLPELTNKDGENCQHSCEAQAWSVACALEAIYDLIHLDNLT